MTVVPFVTYLQLHARGRAQARTARELAHALDLGDRELRAVVHAATEAGHLVCSGDVGYWIPDTAEEAEETIARLQSQGTEMLRRAQALRQLVQSHFGSQLRLL